MSGNEDLIAYLERRRLQRWEMVRRAAIVIALLLASYLAIRTMLHFTGIGGRVVETISPSGSSVKTVPVSILP